MHPRSRVIPCPRSIARCASPPDSCSPLLAILEGLNEQSALLLRPTVPEGKPLIAGVDLANDLPSATNLHLLPLAGLLVADLLGVDALTALDDDLVELLSGDMIPLLVETALTAELPGDLALVHVSLPCYPATAGLISVAHRVIDGDDCLLTDRTSNLHLACSRIYRNRNVGVRMAACV